MKINSEKLFDYINKLPAVKKVKFKVYYDNVYITEIEWDGLNFNWESGTFTSGAFFNPLFDFESIDEFEDIKTLNLDTDELLKNVRITAQDYVLEDKINQLIRNQRKIIERLKDNEKR